MSTSPLLGSHDPVNDTPRHIQQAGSAEYDPEKYLNEHIVHQRALPDYTVLSSQTHPHVKSVKLNPEQSTVRPYSVLAHDSASTGHSHPHTAPRTLGHVTIEENIATELEKLDDSDDYHDIDDTDEPCDYDKKLPAGLPRLAEYMTRGPERALFRTFRTLGVQNLLYMQAELDYLEFELRLNMEHERNSRTTARYATDWAIASTQTEEGIKPRQYHIIMDIRQKLEKYGTLDQ